ncbi:MAG: iron (metal) dependent repressor, DtxR family [Eubacterium sp.]|jgi:Mn-dependent DtxR family transcriptional regulator|nr:iron (metal) dependent repressor, DtxR family [Eubacterium sp.]
MDKNKEFHTVRGYQLLDQNNRLLTSAMEDYLEMIYRNFLTEKYMRINMLSEMLNVKPSSATKMVQKLTQLGFVKYEKYGIIFLTDQGRELGEFLLNRHNIIEKFLEMIGINDDLLVETELIEHNISSNTLENIKILNEFFERTPEINKRFKEFKNSYLNK